MVPIFNCKLIIFSYSIFSRSTSKNSNPVKSLSSITFFKVSDKESLNSILVEYQPILDDEYSYANFELVLFENNYLNAENDVFQIFDKLAKTRLGWIFPLSNLEGSESDFYNNEHLNKYKYVAFQLLLLANEHEISDKISKGKKIVNKAQ